MQETIVGVATFTLVTYALFRAASLVPRRLVVHEHEAGLLYRRGRLARRLEPGAYRLWRPTSELVIVDLRRRIAAVAGQEVLSADGVGLKVSLAVVHELADPVAARHRVQSHEEALHVAVQLALRAAVGAAPVDELLARRLDLGARIAAAVAPQAEAFGVRLHLVEVKDVMFPGELKKIFAEVVRARKEGEAALERARAETAALRSLANAARMLEGNPSLLSLRVLQAVAAGGEKGGTVVLGVPQGVVPVAKGG